MTADSKRVASIMSTKLASFRGQSLQQAIVDCNSSKVAAAATRASRGCGWAATAHLLFFLSFAVVGDRALRPRWRPALQCRQKTSERVCAPQPSTYLVAAADTRLGCYVQFFFLNILLAALSFRTACMKFFSNDINDCIVTVRCIENQSRLYTSHNGLNNRHWC